jgi:hypothetical protein
VETKANGVLATDLERTVMIGINDFEKAGALKSCCAVSG